MTSDSTASSDTRNLAHAGIARNHAETHENKIHSDEIAAKFGFEGALVPGVTVFGLTSIALTKTYDARWLADHTIHTRFHKPAYDNDALSVFLTETADGPTLACENEKGVLLCSVQASEGTEPSQLQQHGFDFEAPTQLVDRSVRPEIHWDRITEGAAFPVTAFDPNPETNATYAAEVDDSSPLFQPNTGNLVHPHFLLSHANQVLVDQFEMPAWIHVGSEIRLHEPLTTDRHYRVFATPIRKWRNKGHEFVTVYMAYETEARAVTEIFHTAIFRVAGA